MIYEHKQYGMSISCMFKDFSKEMDGLFQKAKECLKHDMNYILMKYNYRKYRRGKNRCLRCGVIK